MSLPWSRLDWFKRLGKARCRRVSDIKHIYSTHDATVLSTLRVSTPNTLYDANGTYDESCPNVLLLNPQPKRKRRLFWLTSSSVLLSFPPASKTLANYVFDFVQLDVISTLIWHSVISITPICSLLAIGCKSYKNGRRNRNHRRCHLTISIRHNCCIWIDRCRLINLNT